MDASKPLDYVVGDVVVNVVGTMLILWLIICLVIWLVIYWRNCQEMTTFSAKTVSARPPGITFSESVMVGRIS